jgi:hypothetical protein
VAREELHGNVFPGQGKDKVYVFKMLVDGPGSGVDLIKRIQPGRDLENAWLMFDHVKRVQEWTTMACHVYDATYCKVMTIAICNRVIARKTCTIFRHTLSAEVFSKGTMKSIHCLRLKFISKVYMGLPNVCLILGNFRNSLTIIYVISIICHTFSFRGF